MRPKVILAKVISLFLLSFSLYQTLLSINSILFIYPNLDINQSNSVAIQEGLIEKAILLYLTMTASGVYGLFLMFKSSEKLKAVHFISGIILAMWSIFFMVKTPFTTDPLQESLAKFVNQHQSKLDLFLPSSLD